MSVHLREQWKHTERAEEHIKAHGALKNMCYATLQLNEIMIDDSMQEGISTCII